MPFIQRCTVSLFFPRRIAMCLLGTTCWYRSQANVTSVSFDMSMRIHGLSDFYGNIATNTLKGAKV